MNLREDCMEIHADLIDVCGAQYVSYHTMCRWIEKFRAGKVSFEDGHHLGPPVSDKKEQTMLFVKKIIEEDPHKTIREISERCNASVDSAKRNVYNGLNLGKIMARWTLHILKTSKGNRVEYSKDFLKMFERGGAKHLCDIVKGGET